MYVPISREKGGQTKVVAQAVGRIAVWGVTMDPNVSDMSATSLRGKKITTHPKPMTAYTYTIKTIEEAGLKPEKDVEIITGSPGTEIVPLLNRQADFMMTIEPNTSKAVTQGAHVVLSYPKSLGDQVFTGLMTREDYIKNNRHVVVAVVRSYQKALDDIRANPSSAFISAKKYFPQLEDLVIQLALKRIIDEEVLPKSVLIPDDSWRKAIDVRVKVGDLKSPSSREGNCDLSIMEEAVKQ
jgi:NitT/TauT family transport system substrate-binding protein